MIRNIICAAIILGLLIWRFMPSGDGGQEWPTKPIQIVVPYAAGGGTDTFTRKIQKVMTDETMLPQPLVINNLGGGGGTIGTREVIDAKPDGYKLLCHHEAIMTSELSGTVDYGPEDLIPIAQTGKIILLVIVREDSRFTDLQSLMTEAAERPGELNFGADVGSLAHFSGLSLEQETPGAKMNYITVDGGQVRFTRLTGGHLDAAIFSIAEYLAFRSANDAAANRNIRAIASLDSVRHPSIPDVPTCMEQGFQLSSNNAYYWWAPKGTPQIAIDTMSAALKKAFSHPDLIKELDILSIDPTVKTQPEVSQYVTDRLEQLKEIVSEDGESVPDLPNFPAWTIGIVCLLGILSLVLKLPKEDSQLSIGSSRLTIPALATLGQFILAIFALQIGAPYLLVMVLSIFLIGGAICRWKRSSLLPLVQIALIFGLATELIFTRIFTVPLP